MKHQCRAQLGRSVVAARLSRFGAKPLISQQLGTRSEAAAWRSLAGAKSLKSQQLGRSEECPLY